MCNNCSLLDLAKGQITASPLKARSCQFIGPLRYKQQCVPVLTKRHLWRKPEIRNNLWTQYHSQTFGGEMSKDAGAGQLSRTTNET